MKSIKSKIEEFRSTVIGEIIQKVQSAGGNICLDNKVIEMYLPVVYDYQEPGCKYEAIGKVAARNLTVDERHPDDVILNISYPEANGDNFWYVDADKNPDELIPISLSEMTLDELYNLAGLLEEDSVEEPEEEKHFVFTVNAQGKKVSFSPGNLFWDGEKFAFEKHQYDFPKEWDPKHVGHFFWSKDARTARVKNYKEGDVSDTFFAADNGAIEGFTVLSKDEWKYLFEHSLAKNSVRKNFISIAGMNCIVLKPDGFSGTVADSYTAEEWTAAEASGLVALPFAGNRYGSSIYCGGSFGYCWSGTPCSDDVYNAYNASFDSSLAYTINNYRNYGFSVRLVSVQ